MWPACNVLTPAIHYIAHMDGSILANPDSRIEQSEQVAGADPT